jgi:Icc-related predicted phosphoesterase
MNQALLVCAAGDCHGKLTSLYQGVENLEQEIGRQVDLVLQVGDLGVWPDPSRLDVATQNHGGAGEFSQWLRKANPAPRKTVFIAGNHEDFDFLGDRRTGKISPNLTYLKSGDVLTVDINGTSLRIGGVGGCFGPSDFDKVTLRDRRRRHYTKRQIETLIQNADGDLDVLLLHDAPAGRIVAMNDPSDKPYRRNSPALGLAELIECTQPRICLTGHWHFRTERTVANTRTVGLNAVSYPGSLILMEFNSEHISWSDLAELGGQSGGHRSPDVAIVAPDPLTLELARLLEAWAERARCPQPSTSTPIP